MYRYRRVAPRAAIGVLTAVTYETRSEFHRQLDQIRAGVSLQLALTGDAIAAARIAFFEADDGAIQTAAKRSAEIDEIRSSLETLVVTQMARQAPTASDLQTLVAVLGILSEVGLSAALARDIARRGGSRLYLEFTPDIHDLCSGLFDRTSAMWRSVAGAYDDPSAGVVEGLKLDWEVCADLRGCLVAELSTGRLPATALVEMALVVRFLQRLGDHALEVARAIESVVPKSRLDQSV